MTSEGQKNKMAEENLEDKTEPDIIMIHFPIPRAHLEKLEEFRAEMEKAYSGKNVDFWSQAYHSDAVRRN